MRRLLAFAVLLLACSAAAAQSADPRLEPLLEGQVETLQKLAVWCDANRLYREKNRVLDALIDMDADHAWARKEAGYRRLGKTKWERIKGFRRPIRTNPDMKDEWKTRASGACDNYVANVQPLFARLDPPLSIAEQRRLAIALQVLSPRHEGLRELLGEKKVGRRWLLKESAHTKVRRKQLVERANLLLKGAGDPAEVGMTADERKVEVPWKSARFLPGVRVVGTVPQKEIDHACRLARAAIMFLRMSMRNDVSPYQDYTIYLLSSREEAQRFFHFFPGITEQNRRFAEGLSSCWVFGSSRVVIWPEDKKRREEWVARQTIAMLLQNGWNITTKHAALYEGLGIYLSHKLCGHRSTWYVRPSRYDRTGQDKDEAKTLRETRDWLRLARRRATSTPPRYRRLLGLDVNQMLTDDLLDSYVLGAYLLEAARGEREAFLLKIGSGVNFEHVVVQVFGMDTPAFQERVLRWLKETKSR